MTRPDKEKGAPFRERVYRGLFFLGLGAFALLVIVGATRASVVRKLPSLYDAADIYSRATEMEEGGDLAGAARELRAAMHVQPQEVTGYERLAFVQAAMGDVAGELLTLERAYRHNPLSARANMVLGLAYVRRERFHEAGTRLRLAVTLAPEDPMPHAALGDLLVAEQKHEEAIAVFEKAMALDPDESALHNKAAIAYAYAGRVDLARRHFERAVALDPQNGEAASNLQMLLSHRPEARP